MLLGALQTSPLALNRVNDVCQRDAAKPDFCGGGVTLLTAAAFLSGPAPLSEERFSVTDTGGRTSFPSRAQTKVL